MITTIIVSKSIEIFSLEKIEEMAAAEGVSLNHIARESTDVKRLSKFYREMFGFEEVETPDFGQFKIIWLRLPSSSFLIHLIQRSNELAPSSSIPVKDPSHIRLGHHLCFSISNLHSFHNTLKDKGIETFETTNGNIKRVFFYDPDGNGLEVFASIEDSS